MKAIMYGAGSIGRGFIGLSGRHTGLRLFEGSPIGNLVNHKQHLPFSDRCTLLDTHLGDGSGDLGTYLHVLFSFDYGGIFNG